MNLDESNFVQPEGFACFKLEIERVFKTSLFGVIIFLVEVFVYLTDSTLVFRAWMEFPCHLIFCKKRFHKDNLQLLIFCEASLKLMPTLPVWFLIVKYLHILFKGASFLETFSLQVSVVHFLKAPKISVCRRTCSFCALQKL